jgi:hypothetical protein
MWGVLWYPLRDSWCGIGTPQGTHGAGEVEQVEICVKSEAAGGEKKVLGDKCVHCKAGGGRTGSSGSDTCDPTGGSRSRRRMTVSGQGTSGEGGLLGTPLDVDTTWWQALDGSGFERVRAQARTVAGSGGFRAVSPLHRLYSSWSMQMLDQEPPGSPSRHRQKLRGGVGCAVVGVG